MKKQFKSRIFQNLEQMNHQPGDEVEQVVCVHPNVLYSIGKKAKVAPRLQGHPGAAGAAGMSRQNERAFQEDARGMKMRMDYQSKINCIPNSLTLQYEADKRRSKSSINILKASPWVNQINVMDPGKKD